MNSTAPRSFGRYEVVRPLGRGAVGEVYLARDPKLDRLVAIKILSGVSALPPAEQEEAVERFLREARAAAALSHPNIVTIYDVGEQDNVPYMAMEFLEGTTLDRYTQPGHLLPAAKVVEIGIHAANALAEAHRAGLVHRDIKPANLILLEDGTVKVTDFGLAKDPRTALTAAESIVGTPNYMSPEQIAGRPIDGRSDLFSLAVSLYELLAGQRPFSGDTVSTVLYRIVNEPPPPLRAAKPELPESLETLLEVMLSKEQGQRMASGTELAGALLKVLKQMGGVPRGLELPMPAAPRRPRGEALAAGSPGAGTRPAPSRKPARRGLIVVAILLLPVLASAAAWTAPLWSSIDPIADYRPAIDGWLSERFGALGDALRVGTPDALVPVRTEPPGLPWRVEAEGVEIDADSRLVIPATVTETIRVAVDEPCHRGLATVDPAQLPSELVVNTRVPAIEAEIASDPNGARVTLDGREVAGRTPLTLTLERCRDHELVVHVSGRPERTVRLSADGSEQEWAQAVSLVALDKPADGFVVIPPAPYPVAVSLVQGGRTLGRAGSTLQLEPGRYRLLLAARDLLYSEQLSVTVASSETTRLTVAYPLPGKITVRAVPPGGAVSLRPAAGAGSGPTIRVGETPLNGRRVVSGTYDVFVEHPTKGVQVSKTVVVPPGETPAVVVVGAGDWP